MSKINKIKLSGTTYDIQDLSATSVVNITHAQYEALVTGGTVDPTILYNITDAQAGDLSQYWTSAQTNSAITEAVSGKQDTLISGTNIKTINNESILGSGNIDIQGGGVNVVQTTGTSTTDVMSQDAVTTAINAKADKTTAGGGLYTASMNNYNTLQLSSINGPIIAGYYKEVSFSRINGKYIIGQGSSNPNSFSLVETSAITTSISSSSTDAQVPSAKAVNDKLGGLKLVKLTQSEYDALATKDNSTLYIVTDS